MTSDDDFGQGYFDLMTAARDHWWVRGMHEIAIALTDATAEFQTVLDAGCGSGPALPWLRGVVVQGGSIHGLDGAWPALVAVDRSTSDVQLVQGTVTALPYADSCFDMILSADVLQHLSRADAARAICEIQRVLRPGAVALIRTNAAFGRHWVPTSEDWRLYTPKGLRGDLLESGLIVERITYANALPSLWASTPRPFRKNIDAPVGSRYRPSHGIGIPGSSGPVRSAVMSRALRLEARWLAGSPGRRLPFGHALFALVRKGPSTDRSHPP